MVYVLHARTYMYTQSFNHNITCNKNYYKDKIDDCCVIDVMSKSSRNVSVFKQQSNHDTGACPTSSPTQRIARLQTRVYLLTPSISTTLLHVSTPSMTRVHLSTPSTTRVHLDSKTRHECISWLPNTTRVHLDSKTRHECISITNTTRVHLSTLKHDTSASLDSPARYKTVCVWLHNQKIVLT